MEIELKAHVADNESIRHLLFKKADYQYAFEKEDAYWSLPSVMGVGPTRLRVRSENRTFSDRNEITSTFLTYKIKEVRDGIEVNDEREFEISSSSGRTAEEFSSLLKMMGLIPGARKRKRGLSFYSDGINAELTEVGKLGWFLELEIFDKNYRDEDFEKFKKRLLDFLADMGIAKEAIESRFYSDMIQE